MKMIYMFGGEKVPKRKYKTRYSKDAILVRGRSKTKSGLWRKTHLRKKHKK